ncbi:putative lipid II flippase FtsW [Cohnella cholangitidis]|uniref:Probable peptidoglycan glycosyltransferase FtsW n=1 Tax=Cohnella cholangitidis TaxID=2598458 RepID=A0A7G5BTK4_9BACL|nr:putative lipid II flippase FtsW [Cohnella cholangitidis]QMV40288.1 putative lipid II flippase FtsW [Cohnella cholangitidis]
MKTPESGQRGTPDFLLLILTLLLVGFGLVMVFSASSSMAVSDSDYNNDALYFLKRQLMWVGIGTFIMLVMMNIHFQKYKKLFMLFFIGTLFLLFLVPIIGESRNGATSWLGVGSFGVQPTEFAKLAIILYLAAIIAKKDEKFRDFKRGLLPVMIVVGFFAFLIMLQPDFGSCAILVMCASAIVIAGGSNLKHIMLSSGVLLGLAALGTSFYFLFNGDADFGFRGDRFTAFMDPLADQQGTGYHLTRSLEAFGHGGLFGAGLGNSVQKLFYLPYAYNDFIFAVIGEELGFVGTTIFILFYILFLWRALIVALRCPDIYGTLVGIGLVSLIAIQALINMGGVSGAIPITGVTLPFISYGGSSMLTLLTGMGVLLSISREYNRVGKEPTSTPSYSGRN